MAKVIPLFSGSTGNSYYIGSGGRGILIDVGRSAKQINESLMFNGAEPRNLDAIFITHEHSDHVKGLRVFASKYNIPVYLTAGTAQALEKTKCLDGVNFNILDACPESGKYKSVCTGDMQITPFKTSHDAAESVGFKVELNDPYSVALATDLGFVSEEATNALSGCNCVIIESNHDIGMLKNGAYPYILKRRILSEKGHLSNDACSQILPALVEKGTTRFILSHLSSENNIPLLAFGTAKEVLSRYGMKNNYDYSLNVAPVEYDGTVVYI